MADGPLLVFGPRSLTYDFGADHPLTPRRFGPGIELLRWVGAVPGLAPEPAADRELLALHAPGYLDVVRRFSADPDGDAAEAGIGPGDDPAFPGMHEAAAAVAGGSLRAMEAILDGDVEHAFHPGGGLHHAMRARASGFCIYNDPALAIWRARGEGARVLYVDLDVHHGDGVEALHLADPQVLTISLHESGRTLFPGSGFAEELGAGAAAGTAVNVPLEPLTGPDAWLAAVEAIVPPLAAAFGPDVIVSQHGCDSHAWDPLAHLLVTTTAIGRAARLVDRIAHRHAGGAWLATGGGGYDAYRVVPRAWAFTWLAGAHREAPHHTPEKWRERWDGEARRYGQAPLPEYFDDLPGTAGSSSGRELAASRDATTVALVRAAAVPALLRVAEPRGWWSPLDGAAADGGATDPAVDEAGSESRREPELVDPLTPEHLDRLRLARWTIAPADPADGRRLLQAALLDGATAVGAVAGSVLVGVAVLAPAGRPAGDGGAASSEPGRDPLTWAAALPAGTDLLVALGVAPEYRGRGLGRRLLRALVAAPARRTRQVVALVTAAERDPSAPLPVEARRAIAARLLVGAGFRDLGAPAALRSVDPGALLAVATGVEVEAAARLALRRALAD
ncbi:MAG TPA: acetoin utilization protein AcuC [Candidatus Limnocylindrales bacterium]